MQLYANPDNPNHAACNKAFLKVIADFPQLKLRQPSPEKAPWHWQATINGVHYDQVVNFWPHVMKCYWDGAAAGQGARAMREIIIAATEAAGEAEFSLTE